MALLFDANKFAAGHIVKRNAEVVSIKNDSKNNSPLHTLHL